MSKEGESSLSKADQRFLAMSAGVALTSKCRMRHGALVVRHGKILSASPNTSRNDPKVVDSYKDCSYHAEARALRKAGYPRRVKVFVSRVNSYGELRLSKPCARCQELIDSLGCKVVHT